MQIKSKCICVPLAKTGIYAYEVLYQTKVDLFINQNRIQRNRKNLKFINFYRFMLAVNSMKIAIIDSDLLGRKSQRFPNLVCMKLSSFYKKDNDVRLILDYLELKEAQYDKIFLSKVFSDTIIPEWVMGLENLEYGGTGFFYDKAPTLSYEIEHSKPDYELYNEFVKQQLELGESKIKLKYYIDYAIGFYTRGCFRKCGFCVNKNYNKVENHSEIEEWWDDGKKKICLLDDNFLGCSNWKEKLQKLIETKKSFQFKQGLDIRLITEEKAEMLSKSKYDQNVYFAFDNIKDKNIIDTKLELWRKFNPNKNTNLYVFCGFDREDKYDYKFWRQDLVDLFDRIEIIMKRKCYPYIMRHENYEKSPFRGIYITVCRWCNQPALYKKMSLNEFIVKDREYNGKSSTKYLHELKKQYPDIVEKYFDMKFTNY